MLKNGVFLPELLMPAGNMKKLKTALYFGADAAYIGGKALSLRAFADNFSDEEIIEASKLAHSMNKKLYVTVNAFLKNADLSYAEKHLRFLENKADAAIISDPGLFALCKECAPSLKIHLSTQTNTTNYMAAKFWKTQGAERVVLARECSFKEITEIKEALPDFELEIFAHGAMCVGMSGRCLLSSYFAGKSANSGECVQPCRWEYKLTEQSRHSGEPVFIEEDARGSYFFNGKDLKLLKRLPEICRARIDSIKIEGRMKSEYYVASVANAYRRALDEYAEYGEIKSLDRFDADLDRVSRRAYTEAFFDGVDYDTVSYGKDKLPETSAFKAVVLSYSDGVAAVEMRNRFKAGDLLYVLSPSAADGKSFVAENIYCGGEPTTDAKLVQHAYSLSVPFSLSQGDILWGDR